MGYCFHDEVSDVDIMCYCFYDEVFDVDIMCYCFYGEVSVSYTHLTLPTRRTV